MKVSPFSVRTHKVTEVHSNGNSKQRKFKATEIQSNGNSKQRKLVAMTPVKKISLMIEYQEVEEEKGAVATGAPISQKPAP